MISRVMMGLVSVIRDLSPRGEVDPSLQSCVCFDGGACNILV